MKIAFMCTIIALVFISSAFALTASPASKTFRVHEGEERYTLTVANDESRTLTITLTPTGPLAYLIQVEPAVTLAPGERVALPVILTMPSGTQPGVLESGILIESRPVSGGTVAATSAVLHIISVQTPSTGSYIAGDILASSGILGEDLALTLTLTNTGTLPITGAQALVAINGPQQYTFSIPGLSLMPGETRDAVVSWTPTSVGHYAVTADIQYSGKEERLTTGVTVGELLVTITGVSFGDFRLGEIFRVSVNARNEYGQALPLTTAVTIEQQETSASAKSTATLLAPLEERAIPAYIDSSSLAVGNATLRATVLYAGRSTTSTYPIVIGVDSITLGYAQGTPPKWWLVAIGVLVLVALASVIFIKKPSWLGFRGNE